MWTAATRSWGCSRLPHLVHMRYVLTAVLVVGTAARCFAVTNLVGDLMVEAQRLEGFSKTLFGEGSNNYVAPTPTEWTQFKTLAQSLLDADFAVAEIQAGALGYELLSFQHTNRNVFYWGVRSQETNGKPVKGWGTFFVNTNAQVNALIEAPHPQWDFRTPPLAAEIFVKSGAQGLLIAGVHRHVNGPNTGDPADLTDTIFHAVHEQWSGPAATNTAWQIHGFSPAGHPEFPEGTLAVLSTGQDGTNLMSTNIVRLDQQLEWNGFKAYAYAKYLPVDDPLNLLVNEGVDGQTFTNLGARSNVQGDFSHAAGGTFVHFELATGVRTNTAWRSAAADAIACAVLLSRTNTPSALTPFLLSQPALGSSEFRFSVPTEAYRPYVVEFTPDLANPVWQAVRAFPGDGGACWFTNTSPPAGGGFYRLQGQ